jgi:hypothetical protein
MTNINEKLDIELDNGVSVSELSEQQVTEIISILKNIDSDLIPLLEIIRVSVNSFITGKSRGMMIKKLLHFYGIGNNDILTIRQKFLIEEGKLVKKPFLKSSQKECINILLKEQGINNE